VVWTALYGSRERAGVVRRQLLRLPASAETALRCKIEEENEDGIKSEKTENCPRNRAGHLESHATPSFGLRHAHTHEVVTPTLCIA